MGWPKNAPESGPRFLYCFYAPSLFAFKIGISIRWEQRHRDLRREHHLKQLAIVGHLEWHDGRRLISIERMIHQRLRRFRLKPFRGREWYHCEPSPVRALATRISRPGSLELTPLEIWLAVKPWEEAVAIPSYAARE